MKSDIYKLAIYPDCIVQGPDTNNDILDDEHFANVNKSKVISKAFPVDLYGL